MSTVSWLHLSLLCPDDCQPEKNNPLLDLWEFIQKRTHKSSVKNMEICRLKIFASKFWSSRTKIKSMFLIGCRLDLYTFARHCHFVPSGHLLDFLGTSRLPNETLQKSKHTLWFSTREGPQKLRISSRRNDIEENGITVFPANKTEKYRRLSFCERCCVNVEFSDEFSCCFAVTSVGPLMTVWRVGAPQSSPPLFVSFPDQRCVAQASCRKKCWLVPGAFWDYI